MATPLRSALVGVALLISTGAAIGQTITKATVERAFERVAPRIAQRGFSCYAVNVLVGDLNADGRPDGLVQYAGEPTSGNEGNSTYYVGWAVFLNQGARLRYVLHDDERVPWVIERIGRDGVIYANQLDYAPDDAHCCPSKKTPHRARLTPKGFEILR